MPITSERGATACGLMAVVLWSTSTGLIRSVAQSLGPIGGAALLYTLGAALLLVFVGRPRLRSFPRRYLLWGSLLFVAYELCFSLSLGFANSGTQAIEVGLVNYLWPCLTVLLAIVMNGQRARWIILPGSAMALFGILWIVSGDGISLRGIAANVASNPLSYGLAATGALLWAFYCNVTRRFAEGKNGVVLFFAMTAVALWFKYAFSGESLPPLTWNASFHLVAASSALASGYALWNLGILRGNMTLISTASYFTPVLSSAFASAWLSAALTVQFWQGTLLVTLGSLVCWAATRERAARA
ncbi:aromatic amino acid DMT transporter YddG [Pseudomonas kuykendallii]|uniref:EamA family transporter n=1 Tax=Pseudomonas kuykendallii TaxID=1007099 RepID=A0A2W5D299_9PSED|nr:aromatic amino acid DMT transporter YddG [Pseudomonas kuykendallii]PZP25831.1 MAG: EamA family transporter [Pseudomonas kuykendallii]